MNYFTTFCPSSRYFIIYYIIIVKNNYRIFLKKYLIFYENCDIIDKC